VNISKLLKSLFRSMMMFAVEGEGGGAAQADADAPENDNDVMSLLSEIVGNGKSEEAPEASDDAQEPTEAEKAEQAAAQEAAEKKFKLKVNGEDREYTEAELIVAAQKADAAAQKFEEAANLRKQAEPELAAARQERQQLKQALDVFIPQLQHLLQVGAPDPQLINSDPQEYMRQNYAYQARVAELQQAQAAQAELTRREQFEQAQQLKVRAVDERSKLLDAIPEWKDPAKEKAGADAVSGYLEKSGFTADEMSRLYDHRLVVLSHKAMLYDQMKTQQAQVNQRVEKLPPRVEKPGNGVRPGDGRTQAMRNHAQNGTVESGAAAILNFLD
jgi:hypothetical protein